VRRIAWLLLLAGPSLSAVDLQIEAGRERLRPYENAIVRLRSTAPPPEIASFRVAESNGGRLSKPFRHPEGGIATLYTAPGRAGRFTIEAQYQASKLSVEVEVTPSAPSHRPAESISFGVESTARDFYRELAARYAPLVCQETWFEPKADFLARFDYDGDWRGDNNWDNLMHGSSQAYVYYTAMETATHHFLLYNFFHPRSYSDNCLAGGCHENSSGGLILTIRKDGSKYGRIEVMETLADNKIYSYTSDTRIREGVRRVSGDLRLWRDSHPIVFIGAGTHGVFGAGDPAHSRFSVERMEFTASTGTTYRYGGVAARPLHSSDREVSYELLSILEHWWPRATARENSEDRTFDEYARYVPLGSRPGIIAEEIAVVFFGRKFGANKAKPFWGWHDVATTNRRLLATGQWGLDPAYAVSLNLKFPAGMPFSLDYLYNPYLEGAGRRGAITALPRSKSNQADGDGQNGAATTNTTRGPGERHMLSPPAERPKYNLRSREGQLEFRGRVDGSLFLHIRGDQIEVEYLSGRPMDEIRYRFSQPLPGVEMDEVKLEDIEGRGSVRLLEWPNTGNQYTAKVRIQDEKGGAAPYRFKLVWKR